MNSEETRLLALAKTGHIKLVDGLVRVYHFGWKKWITKKPDQHPKSGRYRFRFGMKRLTIYRNRLVWILHNLKPIPEGFVVDHVDTNNQNDDPSNLRLQSLSASNAQGHKITESTILENLKWWFSFVGLNRCEPSEARELTWATEGF